MKLIEALNNFNDWELETGNKAIVWSREGYLKYSVTASGGFTDNRLATIDDIKELLHHELEGLQLTFYDWDSKTEKVLVFPSEGSILNTVKGVL